LRTSKVKSHLRTRPHRIARSWIQTSINASSRIGHGDPFESNRALELLPSEGDEHQTDLLSFTERANQQAHRTNSATGARRLPVLEKRGPAANQRQSLQHIRFARHSSDSGPKRRIQRWTDILRKDLAQVPARTIPSPGLSQVSTPTAANLAEGQSTVETRTAPAHPRPSMTDHLAACIPVMGVLLYHRP